MNTRTANANTPIEIDRDAVVERWSHLMTGTGFAGIPADLERRRLHALLDRFLGLMEADVLDRQEARELGAHLSELYHGHPEALSRSQEALSFAVPREAPEGRLIMVLSELAAGFTEQAREIILAEQEAIRAALLGARQRALRALSESDARFRAVFDAAAIGMGIGDTEGRIIEVNPALQEMLGYTQEEMKSKVVGQFMHPDDAMEVWQLYQQLITGERDFFQTEKRYFRKDGQTVWCHLTVSLVRGPDGEPQLQIAMMENITERKQAEARLAHQAYHDPLTDLPNRTLLAERLAAALEVEPKDGLVVAVLMVDLDGFKLINDSLGHEAGDSLLCAVSERLRQIMPPDALFARIGGDEFVVLLDRAERADEAAVALADAILASLRQPFELLGHETFVSASVGIATHVTQQTAPSDLLRDADTALYRVKAAGGSGYAVFDPSMRVPVVERLEREMALRRAVERNELTLHYQPMFDIVSGRMVVIEALLRWEHPEHGLLYPGDFIPLAEETGIITMLDEWVLNEACRQTQQWLARFPAADLALAVNLSPRQFVRVPLVERFAAALAATGFPADRLELEITETLAMTDVPETRQALREIRELGVRLVIDDFGTGYSSLGRLHELSFDRLKLDRSFIAGLGQDQRITAIVRAITRLARDLGIAVTAEGVEHAEQIPPLRKLGVDRIQGFLFSRPVPASEIEALLTRAEGERRPVFSPVIRRD